MTDSVTQVEYFFVITTLDSHTSEEAIKNGVIYSFVIPSNTDLELIYMCGRGHAWSDGWAMHSSASTLAVSYGDALKFLSDFGERNAKR